MHCQSLLYIIYFIMTLSLWSQALAELFSAVSEIKPLLNTQKKLVDDFDDYIAREETRLVVLKKYLYRYKKEHDLAMQNISDYLENPINAFSLIKRLTLDLDFIRNSTVVDTEYIKNLTVNQPDLLYPTLNDLNGAAVALARLQKTYLLDIGELSEGRLSSVTSRGCMDSTISTPMTASDCFELGRILYNEKDYRNSLHWMMESLRKLKAGDNLYKVTESNILDYISNLHYMLEDFESALEWTKKLLVLDPVHPNAIVNEKKYQKAIEEKELEKRRKEEAGGGGNKNDDPSQTSNLNIVDYKATYEALCRGDIEISSEINKKLKCTYLTKNHPFLKLAPIKMEQKYIAPDVFIFYDVVSDGEIEQIKRIAKPRINRAKVNTNSGEDVEASYRISKCAWLNDVEFEVVSRVTRRTADFTGLSMRSSEQLQVANYGIGGHYEPHYDHYEEFNSKQRIATVLFYMSDVAQGGATVFTELGLSVFPVKNSALFWMNLHHTGEGNNATRHAACPVLRGSKWASNKWIQVEGQELLKPCNLKY